MRPMTRRPNAIHFRDPERRYRDPIDSIANARTTPAAKVTPSDVARTLLDESIDARRSACADDHVGPVKDGTCGHCGGTV